MIRKTKHDTIALILLVKYYGRRCCILIYLNWKRVQFRHCLNLDIVTPDFFSFVLRHILSDRAVALLVDETHKVLALQVDILHTLHSDNLVMLVVPIQLPRNGMIETVAIILSLEHGKTRDSLKSLLELLFLFLLLDLQQLIPLEGELCWIKLLGKTIIEYQVAPLLLLVVLLLMPAILVFSKRFIRSFLLGWRQELETHCIDYLGGRYAMILIILLLLMLVTNVIVWSMLFNR